jgi:hypothetical protein
MNAKQPNEHAQKKGTSIFLLFTEIIGWLQIFASPFLIGIIIAFVIYFSMPGNSGLVFGVPIAVAGTLIGAI